MKITLAPLRILILMICWGFFTSCNPKQETIRETIIIKPPENNPGGKVDDGGGGSGTSGKTLDEFIDREIQKRAPYVNVVKPVIEQLKNSFPELAADLIHITIRRNWYFVPGELEKIPQNILGAYAKMDQYALQDTRKIWIDDIQYKQMEERSQGALILHELIMGVRLMKYKHRQDHCMAEAAKVLLVPNSESEYRKKISECSKTYPILDGFNGDEGFNLNKGDYEVIRGIVSHLLAETIDVDEVKFLIDNYGVRIYPKP